jgi:hypothetical protein
VAPSEKAFLNSLKNRHGGELTTRRSHLRQILRLNSWRIDELDAMISKLKRSKKIRVTGTKTHITLKLRDS